jgi:hypothetical protein
VLPGSYAKLAFFGVPFSASLTYKVDKPEKMSSTANVNRLRPDERKQLRRMRIISVCWLVLCFVFLFLYDHYGHSGYMLGLTLLSAYVLGGVNSDMKPLRERAKQEAELQRRMRPEYIEAKREHEYSMSSGGPVKYPGEFPSFKEWLNDHAY